MPSNADGSIVIDTELDNSGFEKGSGKLTSALDKLISKVDNIGVTLQKSFETFAPALQGIANTTTQIYNQMAAGGQQAVVANQQLAESGQQAATAAQQTADAVRQQGQAVGAMSQESAKAEKATQAAMSGVNDAAQQATAGIAQAGQQAQNFGTDLNAAVSSGTFTREVNSASKSCDSLSNQIQRIADSARVGFNTDAQITQFQISVEKARDSITTLQQRLQELGQQQVSTAEYEQLASAAQKAEKALFSLYDRRDVMSDLGVKESSREWQRLALQITNAEDTLNRYEASMSAMETKGNAFTAGASTAAYQQTEAALTGMMQKLREYEALAAQFDTVSAPAARSEASLKNVDAELRQKPKDASGASSALSAFGSILKNMAASALRAAQNLAKLSFKALANGVKAAGRNMKDFISQTRNASLTSNGLIKSLTSLKRLLITRIKRMFISSIFNQMKDALNTLTQFSSAFNTAMSNLKNSATGLSANLAVSFGNLIQAIEPALTAIINMVSKAISYLNAFFALLRGKSTVTVAKKQTASYASSLGDAASAAEELKNQVYGFDELNKRNADSSGSGSGGGGATDGSDLFEEVPIDSILPDEVQSFFDRIKAAIEAGDWYGVGYTIAEGLNAGMKVVDDWINGTLRPLGVKWAGIIAQILNGLVDGFDWRLLGKTIGDGLNALADTVNTFLTTFNFEHLGDGIANAINGLFDAVEWDLLGQTFANGWNALIDFIYGVVNTVDFANIGSSLAEFVNNLFLTVDFNKTAEAFTAGVNGIFEGLQTAINEIRWGDIANRITNGLNIIIAGIDLSGICATITSGFNTVVKFLSDLIGTIDWSLMGKKIAEGLQSLITNISWENIGALISNAIVGLLDLAVSFIENVDWFTLASSIEEGIVHMLMNIDWIKILGLLCTLALDLISAWVQFAIGAASGYAQGLADAFKNVGLNSIAGFFQGISDALSGVAAWIQTHIVAPVVNAVKNFFGIHSPSTVFAEIGMNLIAGFLQGITLAWTSITTFFSTALTGLSTLLSVAWAGITTAAATAWTDFSTTVTTLFDGAKTTVVTAADGVKTHFTTTWENIKTNTTTTWGNIKTDMVTNFNAAKTTVSTTAGRLKTDVVTAWNNIQTSATREWGTIKRNVTTYIGQLHTSVNTKVQAVKTSCSDAWDSIKTTATTKWQNITTTVTEKWNNLNRILKEKDWVSIGTNLVNGLLRGIQSTWSRLTSWVSSAASSLTNTIRNVFDINSPSKVWEGIGTYLDQGLLNGLKGSQADVLKTASNLAQSVTDSMSTDTPDLSISTDATATGLDAVADKLSTIAGIFQAITDTITSMGGLVVPQIATGTVVPYKTKVDTAAVQTSDSGDITKLGSDVDERLASLDYKLAELIKVAKSLNLNIDLVALTKAITKQQRDGSLNFGGV